MLGWKQKNVIYFLQLKNPWHFKSLAAGEKYFFKNKLQKKAGQLFYTDCFLKRNTPNKTDTIFKKSTKKSADCFFHLTAPWHHHRMRHINVLQSTLTARKPRSSPFRKNKQFLLLDLNVEEMSRRHYNKVWSYFRRFVGIFPEMVLWTQSPRIPVVNKGLVVGISRSYKDVDDVILVRHPGSNL